MKEIVIPPIREFTPPPWKLFRMKREANPYYGDVYQLVDSNGATVATLIVPGSRPEPEVMGNLQIIAAAPWEVQIALKCAEFRDAKEGDIFGRGKKILEIADLIEDFNSEMGG